jgi:hypothetical protein
MRICTRASGLVVGGLMLTGPLAAQGFEGTVNFRLENSKDEMIQSYKGGKVRMEGMGMEEGWMIMEAGTMKIVAPKEKMVLVMDLKGKGPGKRNANSGKITALGTSETIAGKSCENYLIEDKETHEVCVAKGMGYFMFGKPGGPMGRGAGRGPSIPDLGVSGTGAGGGAEPPILRGGFFPLRITKVTGAKREVQLEATKIEAKSLDAALFETPAGYQEMNMPAMPGM